MLIAPSEVDHVTAVLLVLLTVAVNWTVPADCTVEVDGVKVTTIDPESETESWNGNRGRREAEAMNIPRTALRTASASDLVSSITHCVPK